VVKIDKNTEAEIKRTETDLKETSADIWQKFLGLKKKLMKFKKSTIIIIAILIFSQGCSERKSNDQLFDEFYKGVESKFLDCIDLGLYRYDQYFDIKDCDLFLKPETEKRFEKNGINADSKIWSASLKSTGFDSPNICGYSKKYVGQPDKPLFDKTIYDIISTIDTSIVLRNDTLHYQVDIRKTVIYFKCNNKFFETNIDIKIPKSINIAKTTHLYNREKIQFALNRLKAKYK
jgi:hypothetical protein